MNIKMSDAAVPFVITYRRILKKPKMKRTRKFVGPVQFVKNLLLKALDTVDDAAFETETTVTDPGRTVSVHWAVGIEDPWDISGPEASVVAYRMEGDRPPCGANFEIISNEADRRAEDEVEESVDRDIDRVKLPRDLTPEQFNTLKHIREETMAKRRADRQSSTGNYSFRRPPDPAYSPRPVKPIDEYDLDQAVDDEEFDDMDWSD